MVVVREYSLLMQAQLARMELGRHGIEAEIIDENMAATAPFFAMDGGIRLAVVEGQESEATEILDRWHRNPGGDDESVGNCL